MRPKELAALVTLAALWGGSYLFIRVAVPSLGPATLTGARVLLAALILWIGARALRQPLTLRPHLPRLVLLGAMNAALPYTLIGAAELHITASLAALLNATVPLFSAAIGAIWMGERLTTRRATALALGLAGVGLAVGWSPIVLTSATAWSIGAMLLASVCYAASGYYTKRHLAGVSAPTLALGQQLGALAWLVVPVAALPPAGPVPGAAVWAVVALAVLSTAVAYLLYFYLIARVGPTRTYTVAYLFPMFGMLWGALFLGEAITRGMVAGFALIVASVLLVNGIGIDRLPALWRRGGARSAECAES
jgi:drug/metabolite transporter (DMT)-like permease